MAMMQFEKIFDLTGKTAVVTGAGGILGATFCQALLEFGANVIAIDVSEEALSSLPHNNSALCRFICDIRNRDAVDDVLQKSIQHFGKIDILLNNAASKGKTLSDFFDDDLNYKVDTWKEIVSVNLEGAFVMLQAVGKYMVDQQFGSIIQTGSIYGAMGADQSIYEGSHYLGQQICNPAVYSATKSGILGLTKHFAAAWGKFGVRVNTLSPGGVSSGQNDVFEKKYSSRIPLGRMAKKEEMVGTMLYLASDASNYVTGQNILVDGGLSAW